MILTLEIPNQHYELFCELVAAGDEALCRQARMVGDHKRIRRVARLVSELRKQLDQPLPRQAVPVATTGA